MRPNTPDNSKAQEQQPNSSNTTLEEELRNGKWFGIAAGTSSQDAATLNHRNSTNNSDSDSETSDDEITYDPSKYQQMTTGSKLVVPVPGASLQQQQPDTTDITNNKTPPVMLLLVPLPSYYQLMSNIVASSAGGIPLPVPPPPPYPDRNEWSFSPNVVAATDDDEKKNMAKFCGMPHSYFFATPLYQEQFSYYLNSGQLIIYPYDSLLKMNEKQPFILASHDNLRVYHFFHRNLQPKESTEFEFMIGQFPVALFDCPRIVAAALKIIAEKENINMTVLKILFSIMCSERGSNALVARAKLLLTPAAHAVLLKKFYVNLKKKSLRKSGIFFAPEGLIYFSTQQAIQFFTREIVPAYNVQIRNFCHHTLPSRMINLEDFLYGHVAVARPTQPSDALKQTSSVNRTPGGLWDYDYKGTGTVAIPAQSSPTQTPSSQSSQPLPSFHWSAIMHKTLPRTNANNTPLNLNVHASPYMPSPSSMQKH